VSQDSMGLRSLTLEYSLSNVSSLSAFW
jgi:hypothetical protein